MKVDAAPSPFGPTHQGERPKGILDLPEDVLASACRNLDEVSRTNAARACKRLKSVAPQARHGAVLPTRQELSALGCPSPDCKKVLAAFAPLGRDAKPRGPKAIRKHYAQTAALQTAVASKVVGKMKYEGRHCIGCTEGGVPNGFGILEAADGESYEGECKDGKPHGHGFLKFHNGGGYEGEFKHGKYHGSGLLTWPDGSTYDGEFKDGALHGRGIETWPGGSYKGEFKAAQWHGHGLWTSDDGGTYDGEFKDNEFHGRGLRIMLNRGRYDGEFKDSKAHGRGLRTMPDGVTYDGEYKQGNRHGHGLLTEADGKSRAVMYQEGQLVEGGNEMAGGNQTAAPVAQPAPLQPWPNRALGWFMQAVWRA